MTTTSKVLLIPVLIFAVIGIIFISIAAHELSHVFDYSNIATKGEICLLNIPQKLDSNVSIAYYSFVVPNNYTNQSQSIDKYTEVKAYAVSSLWLFFGFLNIALYLALDWGGSP